MINSNPAIALHEILLNLKNSTHNYSKFNGAWSHVFELETRDTINLLSKIRLVFDLYEKTRKLVETNPRLNKERNILFLDKVGLGISEVNLNGDMSNFHKYISDEVLTALSYMADYIGLVFEIDENSQLNEEEIVSLIGEIELLISNIIDSSLPKDVQALLVKNLNLIKESLLEFKFYGVDGLRVAVEQSIGSLVLSENILEPQKENATLQGFMGFMFKLKGLFDTINAGKDLIAPIIKHFLTRS